MVIVIGGGVEQKGVVEVANACSRQQKYHMVVEHSPTLDIFYFFIFYCNSDSDLTQGSVILYNYSLAFNPAKAKLALEEKGIKVTQFVRFSHLHLLR